MSEYIRLLPVEHHRVTGFKEDGTPLIEWTAPGLVDIRYYPHLAPFTVPAPKVKP